MDTMYVYCIGPCDYGSFLLKTIEDFLKELLKIIEKDKLNTTISWHELVFEYSENWKQALDFAKKHEFDLNDDDRPRVFLLPDKNDFKYGFVFKKKDKMMTYIVSPFELKWLI